MAETWMPSICEFEKKEKKKKKPFFFNSCKFNCLNMNYLHHNTCTTINSTAKFKFKPFKFDKMDNYLWTKQCNMIMWFKSHIFYVSVEVIAYDL